MRILTAILLLATSMTSATAAEITIDLPDVDTVDRMSVTYDCDGLQPFAVDYINAGNNALAVVPIDGQQTIFSNVVSADGARYAAGFFIWWTKGDMADFYDLRSGEDASPLATCSAVDMPRP